MNTLKMFPKSIRHNYVRYTELLRIENAEKYHSRSIVFSLIAGFVGAVLLWLIYKNGLVLILSPWGILFAMQVFYYFRLYLKSSYKVRKMEIMFPDVLQLMASNLRAGMTVDNSLILAARPEFAPLDEEIKKTGREIVTGREMGSALKRMADRIGSDKINKTIYLIISGLRSGGNMADLIEQTGRNMRAQEFTERRVTSGVLMYVIFIFFAVGIGGPILFGLSSILVQVLVSLLGGLEISGDAAAQAGLPFMLSAISISVNFLKWFIILFVIASDFMACLIIGLVQDGDEKKGLKYFLPLVIISLAVFFIVRAILYNFFLDTLTV